MLRDVAEDIAEFIRGDKTLKESGRVNVVVEDKADVGFQLAQGLAQIGVMVLVSITGFRRRSTSGPLITGTVSVDIRCYENPSLNRQDDLTMTAQAVAERLANILHWTKFRKMTSPLLFTGFDRDDVDEANIVRSSYEAEAVLRA